MGTVARTLRLDEEKARDLAAIARVEQRSMNEIAVEAIDRRIEELRRDPEFQARLKRILKEERAVLERLAQ
jgi:predicted transcriptional regulator